MPATLPGGADRGRPVGAGLWTNRRFRAAVEDSRSSTGVDYSGRAALRGWLRTRADRDGLSCGVRPPAGVDPRSLSAVERVGSRAGVRTHRAPWPTRAWRRGPT